MEKASQRPTRGSNALHHSETRPDPPRHIATHRALATSGEVRTRKALRRGSAQLIAGLLADVLDEAVLRAKDVARSSPQVALLCGVR